MTAPNDTTKPKRCTKCGFEIERERAHEFFSPDKRGHDGFYSWCKACRREYNRQRSRDPVEQVRRKEYAKKHRALPEIKEKHRLYVAERMQDPERRKRRRERFRVRYHTDPDFKLKVKLYVENRRVLKLKNGGVLTEDDIEFQIKAQTDSKGRLRCWWCGRPIKENYDIDHRIPISRGGSNGAENIVISHQKCNRSKHTKTPAEFGGRLF